MWGELQLSNHTPKEIGYSLYFYFPTSAWLKHFPKEFPWKCEGIILEMTEPKDMTAKTYTSLTVRITSKSQRLYQHEIDCEIIKTLQWTKSRAMMMMERGVLQRIEPKAVTWTNLGIFSIAVQEDLQLFQQNMIVALVTKCYVFSIISYFM